MFRGGGGPFGIAAITGGTGLFSDGAVTAPSLGFASIPTSGFYFLGGQAWGLSVSASSALGFNYDNTGQFKMVAAGVVSWSSNTAITTAPDNTISRAAANSLRFGGASNATTTSRTEANKATSAIANAVATTVLQVTVPNAAHSAALEIRVVGSLGAGGAIGANEATATNTYVIGITRTPGVATVATATAAFGAVAVAVAGAATVTATAALTAMSGAVGATQTFDVQVTISRSGGSSDNHTCLTYAKLLNANVTGITIA